MNHPYVRWIIRADLSTVLRIERESFEDPWTGDEFVRALRKPNYIGLVAEDADRQVLGYAVYELQDKQIRIVNLAVDPDRRNEGAGEALVSRIQAKLGTRRNVVSLLVRETNLQAQLFFRRHGFLWVMTERGYWNYEDAYWMEYELAAPLATHPLDAGQKQSIARGTRWSR